MIKFRLLNYGIIIIFEAILSLRLVELVDAQLRAKLSRTDAHRVELHLVARQSTGLISKDILNHTEVLNDTHITYICNFTRFLTEETPILPYKVGDEDLEDLEGDEQ